MFLCNVEISIHAPRTGSDVFRSIRSLDVMNFNPRSPHGERPPPRHERGITMKFQSTLPARGATCVRRWTTLRTSPHFNPRSPHGERPLPTRWGEWTIGYFNPRSPHGERPAAEGSPNRQTRISIHAPRTGSDGLLARILLLFTAFQSTLPARGATKPAMKR